MLKNSPAIGHGTITVKDDPRILPMGVLRKTKINELPQLINILVGEMSLIGPRPLTEETFSAYTEAVKKKVTKERPGLSGVGSIVFRDEENLLTLSGGNKKFYREYIAPYKGELEAWYIKNNSITKYFLLILLTILVVLLPKKNLFFNIFPDAPKPEGKLKSLI